MAKIGPITFFQQVKSEMKKITWPSRKETTVGVIAVFTMVVVASIFMFFADWIISILVRLIMGFGA